MSFARWTDDSDLYVYESDEGFMIHIAGRRKNADGELEDIALPEVGKTFVLDTPGECADKCEELGRLGYAVPDYLLSELREEEADSRSIVDPEENK